MKNFIGIVLLRKNRCNPLINISNTASPNLFTDSVCISTNAIIFYRVCAVINMCHDVIVTSHTHKNSVNQRKKMVYHLFLLRRICTQSYLTVLSQRNSFFSFFFFQKQRRELLWHIRLPCVCFGTRRRRFLLFRTSHASTTEGFIVTIPSIP